MAKRGNTKSKGKSKPPEKRSAKAQSFARPVTGILLGGAALLVLVALLSYRPHAIDDNWAGPVGHGLSATLLGFFGIGAYALAGFLLICSSALVAERPRLSISKTLAWGTVAFGIMSLAALLIHAHPQGHLPGGALGALLAGGLRGSLSTIGAALLLSSCTAAALVVATDLWALRAAAAAGRISIAGGAMAMRGAVAAVDLARDHAARSREEGDGAGEFDEEEAGDEPDRDEPVPIEAKEESLAAKKKASKEVEAKAALLARAAVDEAPQDPRVPIAPAISEPFAKKKKSSASDAPPAPADAIASREKKVEAKSASIPTIVEPRPPPKPLAKGEGEKVSAATISVANPVPAMRSSMIAPDGKPEGRSEEKRQFTLFGGRSAFTAPPIDILTGESQGPVEIDRDALTNTADKLRQTLASHGIQGQVTQIRPGPVVTMFEFLPAAGVKVSRISSLSDDLAMGMKALRVRIIAPIPGKGVVGIEIPNAHRQTVVLKELVEQDAFQKSPSKLAMCLGKDVEGMPYIVDLAKMPHVLIAGTTGSGKSVAVNAMIVSMLLRATPEEVRFLMVDPKMLELSVYEGIPHLLLPVVTDSKKAAMALRWAVEEMERRYQLLAECGVRNIGSYNKKVEKEGDDARTKIKTPKIKRVIDLADPSLNIHDAQAAIANGEVEAKSDQIGLRPNRGAVANGAGATAQTTAEWMRSEMQARGETTDLPGDPGPQPAPLTKLPYLVIIIDELADLMMVASREVETYIARLAQMARAAGIHLMVATQRPSTDVVTGVIKANFPTRISFQVASRHDSATIINTQGAENLLGMGDMLIVPPGTSLLTRVHGPYVDEKEIHAVVEHWKAQGAPIYDQNILKPRAEDGEGEAGLDDEAPDELYDSAIAALADMRFISISLLQRKLRVGYNRAARMIERMERDGMVGPADGAKPREVLIRALGEMPGAGA